MKLAQLINTVMGKILGNFYFHIIILHYLEDWARNLGFFLVYPPTTTNQKPINLSFCVSLSQR